MPSPRRILTAHDDQVLAGFVRVREEHEVPVAFPAAALAEAEEAARGTADRWSSERADLTDIPFVTLDPPGSTDLDQAMHLSRRADGYRVRYAIADVAAFVVPGGDLDAAAGTRVETVYCPDTRVPLHPPVLSEGAASLLPDLVRPAVVWTIDLDATGDQVGVAVERAVVRSRAQLDYPTEQARLDAGAEPDGQMSLLTEIGRLRSVIERDRGGVSLGRAEQEVVQHDDGVWELVYRAGLPLEDHNAQISLLTGMAAAQLMIDSGVGVLRTMPAASDRDLRRLRRQAAGLDVPWPQATGYGELLASLDHSRPQTAAFLAEATTLFRGAAWTPFEGSPPADHHHGAIGAPYAHVTAPLRRLVDRYGLEICLAAHVGTEVPTWVRSALPGLAATMAHGARRSATVDRACTDLVEAAVLADHVGRVFSGVAVDDRTVQLHAPAVVARTAEPELPEGEEVQVRLVEADVPTRRVVFALAAGPGGAPTPHGRRPRP